MAHEALLLFPDLCPSFNLSRYLLQCLLLVDMDSDCLSFGHSHVHCHVVLQDLFCVHTFIVVNANLGRVELFEVLLRFRLCSLLHGLMRFVLLFSLLFLFWLRTLWFHQSLHEKSKLSNRLGQRSFVEDKTGIVCTVFSGSFTTLHICMFSIITSVAYMMCSLRQRQ